MAIWKESLPAKQESAPSSPEPVRAIDRSDPGRPQGAPAAARPSAPASMESVIAAALTIEGTIEGSGHVRLVGKFKGDVHVDGDLTIEPGAKVTGSVRAGTVVIGGELEGNIDSASSVKLLETGVLNGDLKAGALTVASGSRMRGQADFGWDEKEARTPRMRVEAGSNP
jgi:cytoskeletal protein CcmA (bactofilin family)